MVPPVGGWRSSGTVRLGLCFFPRSGLDGRAFDFEFAGSPRLLGLGELALLATLGLHALLFLPLYFLLALLKSGSGHGNLFVPSLIIFYGLARERKRCFARCVSAPVILEIGVGDVQACFRRVVGVGGQLAVKFQRTNVGSVLIADEMVGKGLVGDGKREIARLGGRLAHRESIYAGARAGL